MLDKNGFSRPTYDELLVELKEKWLELFGENANTASNSVGGIFIRIIAYFLNKLYELSELVYQSQFVESSSGTTLDQLANNIGLSRHAAQVAIGSVKFHGQIGYVVKAGTLVQSDDELIYITSEDIELTDHEGSGLGVSELLYANGYGSIYNKSADFKNYVVEQVTPVEEITKVEIGLITGGADIESDAELRNRIELSSRELPSSPYNGVLTAIRNVPSVNTVKIVPNDTLEVDDFGNPPKTLHIYVDGGYKEDIAKAIFNSVAAGIQTFGSIKTSIKDLAGIKHEVSFDEPTEKVIFASVKATTDDDFPIDGNEQIKKAVIKYINSIGMGEVIYFSYLYKYIYDSIPGIVVADVKIGTSKDDLAPKDIKLSDIEKAIVNNDTVVVE